MKDLRDKIRGSLIGGAIGDILGYAVEFMSYPEIVRKYGYSGITDFDSKKNIACKYPFSDDTQMTLFTANGLLCAVVSHKNGDVHKEIRKNLTNAYLEWLYTQENKEKKSHFNNKCWITDLSDLYSVCSPGNTCLTSLRMIKSDVEHQNNSKGCGGLMRIAPIGLYGAVSGWDILETSLIAGEAASITHHHSLGIIPSAMLANIIYRIMHTDERITQMGFVRIIKDALLDMKKLYERSIPEYKYYPDFSNIINRALDLGLGVSCRTDEQNIRYIGEGWVAEETLSIALYCAIKYWGDFRSAVIASVNHNGDSDSTGSVLGNIMGCVIGYDSLPETWKHKVECHDVIICLSDDIYNISMNQIEKKHHDKYMIE